MKQKKIAYTPQKLSPRDEHWTVLLFRKFFELQLLKHAGFPIHRGSYPYGRFKPGARNYLKDVVLGLPPCRDRDLMLSTLPSLQAPIEISLRFVTLHEESLEILADLQIANIIQILSLMFMPDNDIHDYAMTLPLIPEYKVEQFKEYKYWFCNTNKKDGWGVSEKYKLKPILESSSAISKTFEQLIKLAYGGGDRIQTVLDLGVPLRNGDRSRILSQACDSELAQLRLSQHKNDRIGVNSTVRNIEKIKNILESIGSPYQVENNNQERSGFGMNPSYGSPIGGIGGDG